MFTSAASRTKLPKTSDSFPIYRLSDSFRFLPSVRNGYLIKALECSSFELPVTIPAFCFQNHSSSSVTAMTIKSLLVVVTTPRLSLTISVNASNCQNVTPYMPKACASILFKMSKSTSNLLPIRPHCQCRLDFRHFK